MDEVLDEARELSSIDRAAAATATYNARIIARRERRRELMLMLLVVLHLPLTLALRSVGAASVALGLLLLFFGVITAISSGKNSMIPISIAAYLVGFDVVQRITGAHAVLHYEFVKYTISIIFVTMIIRRGGKFSFLPLLYILALIPSSIVVTLSGEMDAYDFLRMRRFITFNLTGPVCMGICALFFSRCKLTRSQLQTLSFVIVASIVMASFFGLWNVGTMAKARTFSDESNVLAAGGFGPNQVSNVMAAGAFLCWLMLIQPQKGMRWKLFWAAVMSELLLAMLFTFSRGGVFTFVLATAASLLGAARTSKLAKRTLVIVVLVGLIVLLVVWPFVDSFTGGKARERYTDLSTPRWEIAMSELNVWLDNPIFGSGPGLARYEVIKYLGRRGLPHTEFTRVLAEHGLFGLGALMIFFWGFYRSYRASPSAEWRMWIVGWFVYVCAFWLQAATRNAAPSFFYGLIWLTPVLSGTPVLTARQRPAVVHPATAGGRYLPSPAPPHTGPA